jgi:hypothetical protein
VPEFLNDEWFAALAAALREVPHGIDPPLVIAQHIVDGDDVLAYAIAIGPDHLELRRGSAVSADVVLRQDRATATAIARGELAARTALAEGRLEVHGDSARLVDAVDILTDIAAATDSLRAITSFPG